MRVVYANDSTSYLLTLLAGIYISLDPFRALGVDVPLRNEHDVSKLDGKRIFASMSPSAKQKIDSTPDNNCAGQSYGELSKYSLKDWGYDTRNYYLRVTPNWGGDSAKTGDDESDEEMPVWTKEGSEYKYNNFTCKLCAKIGNKVWHGRAETLGAHLKRM